ncbi:GH1 family beta-glucosidase [Tropicimonas isoalkanivorans]|uniref:Beta-glucosidase n=1 Tax=Tropicimonas isoalkanivorans TaxID=441112 RepID=A0A1I1KMZ2_9RHOB|nr:GH1 family beta-glucosidase [Tropicimonas isoalkanivorans]SFC58810.1 beta-glucosidase [Tropicimonas isoalkanivorans]
MLKRSDFPKGFVFGASTAAYQIEGHSFGGAGPTHWDDFAATPGNVVRAEDGAIACDHYHRWQEDLDLIRDANFDAYRFSASWARVLPEGRGTVNAEGLDFYDKLVDGMLERGIKPMLTLYHWELPSALADLGGWRNRDVASWFADYAEVLMQRLGDRIWKTATINELWCVSFLSHFLGHHAPGVRDIRAAARAMHHVMLAHGTATDALRAMGIGEIGAVCNFTYAQPASDRPEDIEAAAIFDDYYNNFFISGFFRKQYPERIVTALEKHLPDGWQNDFDVIGTPVDWLGVNYYTREIIQAAPGPWPAVISIEGPLPKTQMGWEIYPEGLLHFLRRCHSDFTGDLPLYITENGMANPDLVIDGAVDDRVRIDYLARHFEATRQAVHDGVPLEGYFVWSLMDNYEWAFGYEKRFGLIHVDFDTLQRTPKASYLALKDALES